MIINFMFERRLPRQLGSLESRGFNCDRLESLIDPAADFKRIYKGDKLTEEALEIWYKQVIPYAWNGLMG